MALAVCEVLPNNDPCDCDQFVPNIMDELVGSERALVGSEFAADEL